MVCLRPQGGLVDTLRNETRYRSSPVPLFALARPPRMGDGHFLRAFLGETTCPVPRVPLEKCPDRIWTVRNRLGVGCRGSFLRLVKKDPHHRRGSFCRPRREQDPHQTILDQSARVALARRGPFRSPNAFVSRPALLQPQRSATAATSVGAQRRPRNPRPQSTSNLSPYPVRFGGWERVRVRANFFGVFSVKQRVPSRALVQSPRVESPKSGSRASDLRPWTLDFGLPRVPSRPAIGSGSRISWVTYLRINS
jgi:hypothetical protein